MVALAKDPSVIITFNNKSTTAEPSTLIGHKPKPPGT